MADPKPNGGSKPERPNEFADQTLAEAFALQDFFPNAQEIFTFEYKTVSDIKSTCLVFLDQTRFLFHIFWTACRYQRYVKFMNRFDRRKGSLSQRKQHGN